MSAGSILKDEVITEMKSFAGAMLAASLLGSSLLAFQQPATSQQNSQDVPNQQPSTNNPDVGKQRQPTPKPTTGTAEQRADVPHQAPSTSNPDVGKQRHPTPKKNKKAKSTSSSTQS